MSAVKFDAGRTAQVLVAPDRVREGTAHCREEQPVLFKVLRDATKPEIRRPSS